MTFDDEELEAMTAFLASVADMAMDVEVAEKSAVDDDVITEVFEASILDCCRELDPAFVKANKLALRGLASTIASELDSFLTSLELKAVVVFRSSCISALAEASMAKAEDAEGAVLGLCLHLCLLKRQNKVKRIVYKQSESCKQRITQPVRLSSADARGKSGSC